MSASPSKSNVVPLFAMEHREDDALMALSREHRAAFDTLVARHQHALLRIAAKYLGDVAAAKDVCQAVFLEVYQSRHRYQPRGRFTHWLRRVLLSRCHIAARKGRLVERTRPEPGPTPSQPDELILAEERRRLVEAHVSKLSEKHREVVVLRYAGEHPLEEIADILEVPLGTVKSRLFAAMAALSDSMKEEAP